MSTSAGSVIALIFSIAVAVAAVAAVVERSRVITVAGGRMMYRIESNLSICPSLAWRGQRNISCLDSASNQYFFRL